MKYAELVFTPSSGEKPTVKSDNIQYSEMDFNIRPQPVFGRALNITPVSSHGTNTTGYSSTNPLYTNSSENTDTEPTPGSYYLSHPQQEQENSSDAFFLVTSSPHHPTLSRDEIVQPTTSTGSRSNYYNSAPMNIYM